MVSFDSIFGLLDYLKETQKQLRPIEALQTFENHEEEEILAKLKEVSFLAVAANLERFPAETLRSSELVRLLERSGEAERSEVVTSVVLLVSHCASLTVGLNRLSSLLLTLERSAEEDEEGKVEITGDLQRVRKQYLQKVEPQTCRFLVWINSTLLPVASCDVILRGVNEEDSRSKPETKEVSSSPSIEKRQETCSHYCLALFRCSLSYCIRVLFHTKHRNRRVIDKADLEQICELYPEEAMHLVSAIMQLSSVYPYAGSDFRLPIVCNTCVKPSREFLSVELGRQLANEVYGPLVEHRLKQDFTAGAKSVQQDELLCKGIKLFGEIRVFLLGKLTRKASQKTKNYVLTVLEVLHLILHRLTMPQLIQYFPGLLISHVASGSLTMLDMISQSNKVARDRITKLLFSNLAVLLGRTIADVKNASFLKQAYQRLQDNESVAKRHRPLSEADGNTDSNKSQIGSKLKARMAQSNKLLFEYTKKWLGAQKDDSVGSIVDQDAFVTELTIEKVGLVGFEKDAESWASLDGQYGQAGQVTHHWLTSYLPRIKRALVIFLNDCLQKMMRASSWNASADASSFCCFLLGACFWIFRFTIAQNLDDKKFQPASSSCFKLLQSVCVFDDVLLDTSLKIVLLHDRIPTQQASTIEGASIYEVIANKAGVSRLQELLNELLSKLSTTVREDEVQVSLRVIQNLIALVQIKEDQIRRLAVTEKHTALWTQKPSPSFSARWFLEQFVELFLLDGQPLLKGLYVNSTLREAKSSLQHCVQRNFCESQALATDNLCKDISHHFPRKCFRRFNATETISLLHSTLPLGLARTLDQALTNCEQCLRSAQPKRAAQEEDTVWTKATGKPDLRAFAYLEIANRLLAHTAQSHSSLTNDGSQLKHMNTILELYMAFLSSSSLLQGEAVNARETSVVPRERATLEAVLVLEGVAHLLFLMHHFFSSAVKSAGEAQPHPHRTACEAIRRYLVYVLFPVLQFMSVSNANVLRSALLCLTVFAAVCGYDSIEALVTNNFDYILDACISTLQENATGLDTNRFTVQILQLLISNMRLTDSAAPGSEAPGKTEAFSSFVDTEDTRHVALKKLDGFSLSMRLDTVFPYLHELVDEMLFQLDTIETAGGDKVVAEVFRFFYTTVLRLNQAKSALSLRKAAEILTYMDTVKGSRVAIASKSFKVSSSLQGLHQLRRDVQERHQFQQQTIKHMQEVQEHAVDCENGEYGVERDAAEAQALDCVDEQKLETRESMDVCTSLVNSISEAVINFVFHPVVYVRRAVFGVCEQAIVFFDANNNINRDNLVHRLWSQIAFNLVHETNKAVLHDAFQLILLMIGFCGDFVERRFEEDVQRRAFGLLQKMQPNPQSTALSEPSVMLQRLPVNGSEAATGNYSVGDQRLATAIFTCFALAIEAFSDFRTKQCRTVFKLVLGYLRCYDLLTTELQETLFSVALAVRKSNALSIHTVFTALFDSAGCPHPNSSDESDGKGRLFNKYGFQCMKQNSSNQRDSHQESLLLLVKRLPNKIKKRLRALMAVTAA